MNTVVDCIVNLDADGGMYDLGEDFTTGYRSGAQITSRYVEVFPINYETGTEYEYCPVDENGNKLYTYPTPVSALPPTAVVAIYANTPQIAEWSMYVRSILEQENVVGAPNWRAFFPERYPEFAPAS